MLWCWMKLLLLFALCSKATAVSVNCTVCPALSNTDCRCNSVGLYCYWSSAPNRGSFPAFNNASKCTPLSVYIANYQFQTVPANAFGNYQFPVSRLTLYREPIEFIDQNAFTSPNIQNYLNYIYISQSNLTTVPELALQKLNNLQTLSLQYSKIRHLPPDGFSTSFQQLTYLKIAHSPLATIASYAFRGLGNVTVLDLSYNSLTLLPQNAFTGLSKVSHISLYQNNILVIQTGAFNSLPMSSMTMSLGKATVQPGAFQGMANLQAMYLYFNGLSLNNKTCFASVSLSCTDLPSLTTVSLHYAACQDLLQNFQNQQCIKTLNIYYNYNSKLKNPVCLNQIGNMKSVNSLYLSLKQVVYLNASGMTNLTSLTTRGYGGGICDESLGTMPRLTTLQLTTGTRRFYIPKAVQNMPRLSNLLIYYSTISTKIYCNCSNYWFYQYSLVHKISTSSWKCNSGNYPSVTAFFQQNQGNCGGKQPAITEVYANQCQGGAPCNPNAATTGNPMGTTKSMRILKIFLEYFDNTAGGGLLAQSPATHCDNFWFTGIDQCDIGLKICIELLPQNSSMSKCASGWVDLGQVTSNKNNATLTTNRYNGWSNPMVYPMAGSPYQGFQLKFIATDVDNGGSQLIDQVACQFPTSAYSKYRGVVGCKHRRLNGYPTYFQLGYMLL